MRFPHYWRRAKRASAPAEICAIDTEAWHGSRAMTPEGELQTWRCGCALAYRMEGGRRTRIQRLKTTRRSRLLPFITARLNKRRPLWLIGHNLPYDLAIAGMWGVLCSPRMLVSSCAIADGVFFVRGILDGSPIVLCDTFNYHKCSLDRLGDDLKIPKLPMPDQSEDDHAWLDYCERDVEVCAAAFDALSAFMTGHDLGPWSPTAAGLTFGGYRHKYMKHLVLVHDNAPALKLERAAYYGGICDVAFVGKAPASKFYELDVQSMYPFVCMGDLPYRIEGYSERIGPAALASLATQFAVVADVSLDTERMTFPTRRDKRVIYPTGAYRTALPDPELREAMRLGCVQRVHKAAWYHKAPIWAEYMRWLLSQRQDATNAGNKSQAAICKLLANSLYGKAGQRNVRWEPWGEGALRQIETMHGMPPGELERHYDRPPLLKRREGCYLMPERGLTLRLRDYWGFTEVQVDYGEGRDSCPAIAAHVTSAARLLLREYQDRAGAGHWYYSDTDSVWVDEVGFKRLIADGSIANDTPGKLSIRSEHGNMTIHAPKDYEAGATRKVKGARKDATWEGPDVYEQNLFPGAASMMQSTGPAGVLIARVRRALKRGAEGKTVGPDGWTAPVVIDHGAPWAGYIPLDTE